MSEFFYKHRTPFSIPDKIIGRLRLTDIVRTVMVSLLMLSWAVGVIRFGTRLCRFTEYELLYYQRNKAL